MAERTLTKPEIASQKRVIKLPPAIGDWTTYKPPRVLVKKVKAGLYGFDRLSKDELNTALLIHYRFIGEFLSRLKIDLNMSVEFLSCQIEQTTYLNFLRTLTGAAAQGKLAVAGLHEAVQLYFDLNLANSIINHALGTYDLEPLNRALTESEIASLNVALGEYLPDFAAAFNHIFAPPTYAFVSSPDVTLEPSINPSSTFVFFAAEATMNEKPGKIIFGYPGGSLRSLLKNYLEKEKLKPLNFSRLPTAALNQISARVAAGLGSTSLLTSELNQLEPGDVVSLETATSAPVNLKIGGNLLLKAQPGILGKRRAVRLAGPGEGEELELPPPITLEEQKPEAAAVEEPVPAEAAVSPLPEQEISPEEELTEEEFEEEEEFPEDFLEEEEKGG